ncbi:glycogen/starch synthase [bacterium]|nr:glycogen/starch synthase [bacterium]NUN45151.1 glycogen/starch synthase [bacterium]
MKKSKIFFVAPAVYPFARDGRVAEFAAGLPAQLQSMGHEVRVLMPKYSLINERKHIIRDIIRMKDIPVKMYNGDLPVSVKSGFIPETKTQIYFAEQEKYYKRSDLYRDKRTGEYYKDNDERFILLARTAIETLKTLGWQPDIVHCIDWQSGLLPAMIREEQKQNNFFKKTIITFSVINTEEPALFDKSVFDKAFGQAHIIEKEKCFHKSKFSFLKTAIMHSDAVTIPMTHKHLKTITKPANDVEAILASAKMVQESYFGGEHNYWSPVNNNTLYKSYSAEKLERKVTNREGFLDDKRTGFDPAHPIFGILVEDLASQHKALSQFLKAVKDVKLQLFILANDSISSVSSLKPLITKNPNHTFFTMQDPEEQFRHNFFAVADMLYIPPSDDFAEIYFMNGIRYGGIPVIREECIISDRFTPTKEKSTSGNAIIYSDEKDMVKKIAAAVSYYETDKNGWDHLVRHAMKSDANWALSASSMIKLYEKALAKLK